MSGFQNVVSSISEPADQEYLGVFSTALNLMNKRSRSAVEALYGQCKEISLCYEHVSADELRFGSLSLFPCSSVLFNISYDSNAYTAFDKMLDDSLIVVRLHEGEIELGIGPPESEDFRKLPLSIDRYLDLLDECRGLFPWQRAIQSKAAGLMDDTRKRFLEDLRIVFPDADHTLF
ncbi:hypothetical protein [Lysobacter rhizosphaerae]